MRMGCGRGVVAATHHRPKFEFKTSTESAQSSCRCKLDSDPGRGEIIVAASILRLFLCSVLNGIADSPVAGFCRLYRDTPIHYTFLSVAMNGIQAMRCETPINRRTIK